MLPTAGNKPPLVPELSQLEQLQRLHLGHMDFPVKGGIPREWVQPGAFPQLLE